MYIYCVKHQTCSSNKQRNPTGSSPIESQFNNLNPFFLPLSALNDFKLDNILLVEVNQQTSIYFSSLSLADLIKCTISSILRQFKGIFFNLSSSWWNWMEPGFKGTASEGGSGGVISSNCLLTLEEEKRKVQRSLSITPPQFNPSPTLWTSKKLQPSKKFSSLFG